MRRKQYRHEARTLLSHAEDPTVFFQPGEDVTEYLRAMKRTPDEIQNLIDMGAIERLETEPEAAPAIPTDTTEVKG